jgi:hypothetical protein
MKAVLKVTFICGLIAWMLSNSVPRLLSDLWHGDFVPAQDYALTDYHCTNVNGFMFNHCTVKFVSQSGQSQEFTDWRFGRAPREWPELLQRRNDASAMTTDVSRSTVWNRLLVALMLVLFGTCLAAALLRQEFKDEEMPSGAPSEEPAGQPAGRATFGSRSTFGKRHA